MKLSIVIPAYNEEKRISKTLNDTLTYLSRQTYKAEIIVVDDGSRDHTVDTVERVFKDFPQTDCRCLENEINRGKGFSVRKGMLEARGDYMLFTDADLSTPIEDVEKLLKSLETGASVAIGSRALSCSNVEVHQNLLRELLGKVFNRLARILTFRGIKDSQCGFKLFTSEAGKRLFSLAKMDGFSFDVEILYLAQKLGYKVSEVPVTWRNSPATKVRMFSDPIKMFIDLFKIKLIHWGHEETGQAGR